MGFCESALDNESVQGCSLALFENIIEIKGMIIEPLCNFPVVKLRMTGDKLLYFLTKGVFLCFAVLTVYIDQKNFKICTLKLLISRRFFKSLAVYSSQICFSVSAITPAICPAPRIPILYSIIMKLPSTISCNNC